MRVFDCYFLDKMEDGLGNIAGIPLGTVILGTMTNAMRYNRKDKAFPHVCLLTILFEHFGVDLQGEVGDVYHFSKDIQSSMIFKTTYDRPLEGQQH